VGSVSCQWEDQPRRRLKDLLSTPKVQTRRRSSSMFSPARVHLRSSVPSSSGKNILIALREFLKNAEADEKKGNNADATKKDAGR
jgi:hypothetical protein